MQPVARPFLSCSRQPATSARPAACSTAAPAKPGRVPLRPSRMRFDPDRLVGVACALLLPLALWIARH